MVRARPNPASVFHEPEIKISKPTEPSSHSSSVQANPMANFHAHSYPDYRNGYRVVVANGVNNGVGYRGSTAPAVQLDAERAMQQHQLASLMSMARANSTAGAEARAKLASMGVVPPKPVKSQPKRTQDVRRSTVLPETALVIGPGLQGPAGERGQRGAAPAPAPIPVPEAPKRVEKKKRSQMPEVPVAPAPIFVKRTQKPPPITTSPTLSTPSSTSPLVRSPLGGELRNFSGSTTERKKKKAGRRSQLQTLLTAANGSSSSATAQLFRPLYESGAIASPGVQQQLITQTGERRAPASAPKNAEDAAPQEAKGQPQSTRSVSASDAMRRLFTQGLADVTDEGEAKPQGQQARQPSHGLRLFSRGRRAPSKPEAVPAQDEAPAADDALHAAHAAPLAHESYPSVVAVHDGQRMTEAPAPRYSAPRPAGPPRFSYQAPQQLAPTTQQAPVAPPTTVPMSERPVRSAFQEHVAQRTELPAPPMPSVPPPAAPALSLTSGVSHDEPVPQSTRDALPAYSRASAEPYAHSMPLLRLAPRATLGGDVQEKAVAPPTVVAYEADALHAPPAAVAYEADTSQTPTTVVKNEAEGPPSAVPASAVHFAAPPRAEPPTAVYSQFSSAAVSTDALVQEFEDALESQPDMPEEQRATLEAKIEQLQLEKDLPNEPNGDLAERLRKVAEAPIDLGHSESKGESGLAERLKEVAETPIDLKPEHKKEEHLGEKVKEVAETPIDLAPEHHRQNAVGEKLKEAAEAPVDLRGVPTEGSTAPRTGPVPLDESAVPRTGAEAASATPTDAAAAPLSYITPPSGLAPVAHDSSAARAAAPAAPAAHPGHAATERAALVERTASVRAADDLPPTPAEPTLSKADLRYLEVQKELAAERARQDRAERQRIERLSQHARRGGVVRRNESAPPSAEEVAQAEHERYLAEQRVAEEQAIERAAQDAAHAREQAILEEHAAELRRAAETAAYEERFQDAQRAADEDLAAQRFAEQRARLAAEQARLAAEQKALDEQWALHQRQLHSH